MALNEKQLTEIYHAYADMVCRVCYTNLKGHRADAEDAVQTTFLNLMRGGSAEKIKNMKAWLITCATNSCKNMLHRSHRKDLALEDVYARADVRDDTLELILKLPKYERLAIYLHYYEGYSAKEIGPMLGKSESTVWGYLSRGRSDLKKQLTEEAIS